MQPQPNIVVGGDAESICAVLDSRARVCPERRAFTFESGINAGRTELSYGALRERATRVAALLRQRFSPGDRVLLQFGSGVEFIEAFLGCLYAGVIAIPTFPPDPARRQATVARLQAIADDCRARGVLCENQESIETLRDSCPKGMLGMDWIAADEEGAASPPVTPATGDAIAFIQYTSGSTATPKGVVLTHRNVLANQEVMRSVMGASEDSTIVSWLPMFHDMGLIGSVLHSIYAGAHCVLLTPLSFLQHPERWLAVISEYRGTISGAPNFGYELCVRRVTDQQIEGLDLSSWRTAFCGAEPARAQTLRSFCERFASSGFKSSSVHVCYGLAEATLLVAGGEVGVRSRRFGADAYRSGRADEVFDGSEGIELTSCGRPAPGVKVDIVDPGSMKVSKPGEVGEIWVAGGSVAQGYWNRDAATRETFRARPSDGAPTASTYLRTGDLGFMHQGELFVCGRLKDTIIVRGRKVHAEDIEASVARSCPMVRANGVIAFGVKTNTSEGVVVVAALDARPGITPERALEQIRDVVITDHDVDVVELRIVRPSAIPRTSSGKVQRRECKHAWESGELARATTCALVAGHQVANSEVSKAVADADVQRSPIESSLAALWQRALAVEWVNLDDDFLKLGGDSVRAAQVLAEINEQFGLELTLRDVFSATTLRELASLVDDHLARKVRAMSDEQIEALLADAADPDSGR